VLGFRNLRSLALTVAAAKVPEPRRPGTRGSVKRGLIAAGSSVRSLVSSAGA